MKGDDSKKVHQLLKKKSKCLNCGSYVFTIRHSNWLECVQCNRIKII